MAASTKKGIGYSPLTDKVYIGRQNKEKGMWVGEKEDITSDFIGVALSYFSKDTIRTITGGNDDIPNLVINVKDDEKSIEKLIKALSKRLKQTT